VSARAGPGGWLLEGCEQRPWLSHEHRNLHTHTAGALMGDALECHHPTSLGRDLSQGFYDVQEGFQSSLSPLGFRAKLRAGPDGAWAFNTIRMKHYPIPKDGPVVSEWGERTHTHR
jgi:hypothetical protein